jgi:diacylglycerol kinase
MDKTNHDQIIIKKKHTRVQSFYFAINGLVEIITREINFKIQLCAAIAALLTCYFLNCSTIEWVIIIICIGFVLVSEAINTVSEALLDLFFPEKNARVGKIKDMAAAIPLVASVISLSVGLLIFIPKIRIIFSFWYLQNS